MHLQYIALKMSSKVQIMLTTIMLLPSPRASLLTRTARVTVTRHRCARNRLSTARTFLLLFRFCSTALFGNTVEGGSDNIRSFCHAAQWFGPCVSHEQPKLQCLVLCEDTKTWSPKEWSLGLLTLHCQGPSAFRDL